MANTHEMDLSHIIHDDRLNLNQTRRFEVGDIVKLRAVPTGDPKKSKFALVEEVRSSSTKSCLALVLKSKAHRWAKAEVY